MLSQCVNNPRTDHNGNEKILSGNNVSDVDIRNGVDIFLTDIMEMDNISHRNLKLTLILKDLTNRGSDSQYFDPIVKEIHSL